MTQVNVSLSRYTETPDVLQEFNRAERKRLRLMMRRLQFLEHKVRTEGGLASPTANGGAAYAEWEIEALEWLLVEVGYLVITARADD